LRSELVIKGRSLTGTSDLTLIAPLRQGLVPSLDAISYKTRIKRLMKTLQGGRVSMHEYATYRPLSDAVERVAAIQSFRVAVLEPQDQVMLAVTFDGTWESYIRVLWQKVGTLLDIIFCNTEGYVVSHTAGFEAWADWVRRVQVETSFYFNTHGLTVHDVAYLRGQEATLLAPLSAAATLQERDLHAVRRHVVSAEVQAWNASQTTMPASLETLRQGLQALAVLFRLTDSYLPGTPDGEILRRAALDLLEEFQPLAYGPHLPQDFAQPIKRRFQRQLDWLAAPCAGSPEAPRAVPELPDSADTAAQANIQSGILRGHEQVTHGCLLLLAVDDPLSGARLLERVIGLCTSEAARPAPGALAVNVAVSHEGLRALGLTEAQLAFFPQEFREGMEARASMLGDFRANHPRRWKLPLRNWNTAKNSAATRVEMSAVHMVVQLRVGSGSHEFDATKAAHPLHASIQALVNAPGSKTPDAGLRLLRVEGMRRLQRQVGGQLQTVEHFGFVDGNSDPVFNKAEAGTQYRNQVQLGDFILGHDNTADAARPPATPAEHEADAWLRDGSFLVVRKLRQHLQRLNAVLQRGDHDTHLPRENLLAKMMGRWPDGQPLVSNAVGINDFNYAQDSEGQQCPFHAHIRRANPRTPDADQEIFAPPPRSGGRPPRLLRRGMSYGPPVGEAGATEASERGLFFMAYNASISEQFEVVQRWIAGGNSSGGSSRQSDPFLGVPDIGEQRSFRFEDQGQVHRLALDTAPALDEQPQPLVELEWGLYLFTPSLAALRKLRNTAAAALRPEAVWSADAGERALQALLKLEREQGSEAARQAWKTALEDPEEQEKFRAAGIWAAIRSHHGGVLRTAYGVLVADAQLVQAVLADTTGYTVAGYRERMSQSIGEIFLGLDGDDPQYAAQSAAITQAIGQISMKQAFDLTLALTQYTLGRFIAGERDMAALRQLPRWELNIDAKEVSDLVLARLCQLWFGLPDAQTPGAPLVPGSWRWDWREDQPPIYPAHFTAPSRYIFQPWPNEEVQRYGKRIGLALTAALARFLAPHRAAGTVPQTPELPKELQLPKGMTKSRHAAPLAASVLAAFPGAENDALTARSFCGALMGFLPTVDGNFRLSLNEWLRDGSFWQLRAACADLPNPRSFEAAVKLLRAPLVQAMQLRPSPELIWRRARHAGLQVGGLALNTGETVVLGLVSAGQQHLAAGSPELGLVFGGNRSAAAHPTHACPGYAAGMGVLLGLLAGLLTESEQMRASPAALSFTLEGQP
jgi:Dyp-type peroxidase family